MLPPKIQVTPARIVLSLLWLLAVAAALLSLLPGLASAAVVVGLASVAYMLGLIGHLARLKPHAADLPPLDFLLTPRLRLGAALIILLAGLVVVVGLGLVVGPVVGLLAVSALLGLGLGVAWRRHLTRRVVALGLMVGALAGLGIAFLGNGDQTWAIFNLITLPPIFVGGALVAQRTGLA